MVFLVAVIAEVSFFCDAVHFRYVWGDFRTVFARDALLVGELLLGGKNGKVNQVAGVDLIVFEDRILVQEYLRCLFLIIKIY